VEMAAAVMWVAAEICGSDTSANSK
jgi:hypothetical protein